MSFILDALKKAEAERNRRTAPVLMDARIAPPRRGLPAWAWALGAVLLVNLALLTWLLLREPTAPAAASAALPAPAPEPAPGLPAAPASAVALPQSAPVAPAVPQAQGVALPAPASVAPSATAGSSSSETLPSFHELRAAGIALPDLQLNLHVYDAAPTHRSVMLNGNRVREGEYTPDGVKVERITPVGVVLEAAGRRFRLEAGG